MTAVRKGKPLSPKSCYEAMITIYDELNRMLSNAIHDITDFTETEQKLRTVAALIPRPSATPCRMSRDNIEEWIGKHKTLHNFMKLLKKKTPSGNWTSQNITDIYAIAENMRIQLILIFNQQLAQLKQQEASLRRSSVKRKTTPAHEDGQGVANPPLSPIISTQYLCYEDMRTIYDELNHTLFRFITHEATVDKTNEKLSTVAALLPASCRLSDENINELRPKHALLNTRIALIQSSNDWPQETIGTIFVSARKMQLHLTQILEQIKTQHPQKRLDEKQRQQLEQMKAQEQARAQEQLREQPQRDQRHLQMKAQARAQEREKLYLQQVAQAQEQSRRAQPHDDEVGQGQGQPPPPLPPQPPPQPPLPPQPQNQVLSPATKTRLVAILVGLALAVTGGSKFVYDAYKPLPPPPPPSLFTPELGSIRDYLRSHLHTVSDVSVIVPQFMAYLQSHVSHLSYTDSLAITFTILSTAGLIKWWPLIKTKFQNLLKRSPRSERMSSAVLVSKSSPFQNLVLKRSPRSERMSSAVPVSKVKSKSKSKTKPLRNK